MDISKKKVVAIVSIAAVLIAAGLGGLLYAKRPPTPIIVSADVDAVAKKALSEALDGYNAQAKHYVASLATDENERIDLNLGPYREGGIAWRSIGWRIWTRLETLAGVEGKLNRSLIRHFREGQLDVAAFEKILYDIRGTKIAPLVLPEAPGSYRWALNQYLTRLGGADAALLDKWAKDKLIESVPDIRTAVDQVVSGRAALIIGGDQMGGWLGRSTDNHPEGFSLPGSRSAEVKWVLGKVESFTIAEKPRSKAGTIDLLVYLTSKGISRQFANSLAGEFYYWTELPTKGLLPKVEGPTEFLDPEQAH